MDFQTQKATEKWLEFKHDEINKASQNLAINDNN